MSTGCSSGGFKIELDDNNKNNVQAMEVQAQSSTSMLSYFKALNKIKSLYPKGATMSLENGSVYLIMTINGGGHTLKIYLKTGQATAQSVADDGYGIDSTGFQVLNGTKDPIYSALGGDSYSSFMAPAAPVGTIVALYK